MSLDGLTLGDFDYHLPEGLIAQRPLEDRASSRLLHLEPTTGRIHHRRFSDTIDLLAEGDVLVVNNTRVTAVRLHGARSGSGGRVEALLLHPSGEPDTFLALCRPAKKLKVGDRITFTHGLSAEVIRLGEEGRRTVHLKAESGSVQQALAEVGETPLPPYIHERLNDPERYQTVYASQAGSAAAPTAGLHFTPDLLRSLKAKGIGVVEVTLDVSLDTFRPVQVENLDDHVMHGETCRISEEAAERLNSAKGRIIAVGTTAVRTLETFADSRKNVGSGERISRLFIKPGFEFQIVSGMFTNFHMPKTTMMLMISAMAGREAIMSAYKEAIKEQYRFLSFGDSMLLLDPL